MSRLRVILVIFSVTAFLIFTQQASVKQKELLQQLWQKQLRFECLVNPAGLPQIQPPTFFSEDSSE
ncbi:MAG: hypothetical protein ACYSPI_08230 [Planctomycetota bacterium]|jgi:hypothetical protein